MVYYARYLFPAAAVLSIALGGCGAGNSTSRVWTEDTDKIIGDNDLTSVIQSGENIPEKYRPLIKAFGQLQMGCTATHIGNNIVLTAGHCFDAPATRDGDMPCSATIKWGLMKDKEPFLISKCTTILAYELNENRDYTIFAVDQAPEEKVEVDVSVRPAVETPLTIFSFPQMRPMEWSKTCVLKPASAGGWGTAQFSHQCDTEAGSSGSTVLDDRTLKVIGIHDGGRDPWNYATYLVDTPVKEYLNGIPPAPTPGPDELPSLSFGPMKNNANEVLTTFDGNFQGQTKGNRVSFELIVDTEKNYDVVTVTAPDDYSKNFSGKGKYTLTDLKLPVQVKYKSDNSVASKLVSIRKIKYSTVSE